MRRIVLFYLLFFFIGCIMGQNIVPVIDSVVRFYYSNGSLSSEGMMQEGKPNGYWKSYHENGTIKSEGNRKRFELDSLWKFYNSTGALILEITYKEGKKNGTKTSWLDNEIIKEQYINDIKQGSTQYYHQEGWLMKEIPFVNGLMEGTAKEYNQTGNIITVTEYKKGFIVSRMNINRHDKEGLKQGRWITFWGNGNMQQDGTYKNDLQHGYFKRYSEKGDLVSIHKYTDGILQKEAQEIQTLETGKTYYPDGKIQTITLYRNGYKEGISREFSTEGKLIKTIEYLRGTPVGEGLVLESGNKTGYWKEFYLDSVLRAEGNYTNDCKTGPWNYYHENGQLEQRGTYNQEGNPEGNWQWFFDSGQLNKEENYYKGKKDGLMEQYNVSGLLVEKGEYMNGLEEGYWFHRVGNYCDRGWYRDGLRSGLWQSYRLDTLNGETDSVLLFRGNFFEDIPEGEHVRYWDKGKIREKGVFVIGKKEGNWITYNDDGTIFLITTFNNGIEIRYDGIKIKPPLEQEE